MEAPWQGTMLPMRVVYSKRAGNQPGLPQVGSPTLKPPLSQSSIG